MRVRELPSRIPGLTAEETHLIRYPPTPSTWLCEHVESVEDEDGNVSTRSRFLRNAGTWDECWMCREPKPESPRLLWPTYEAASKKLAEKGA